MIYKKKIWPQTKNNFLVVYTECNALYVVVEGGGGEGGYVGALNGKKAVGHPAANCAILYGPTQ